MLKNYFKVALRNIFRQKAYAFINISGLAIGISCCLLIVSYVLDELSYDNFHPEAEQTYRIALDRKFPDNQFMYARSPVPMGPTVAREIPEVTAATRMFNTFGSLTFQYEDRYFDERNVIAVDSNFFDFFGVELLMGDSEKVLNDPNSLIITEEMATKYFGNEEPLGKQLEIQNIGQMMVRGVVKSMPSNAHFHFDFLFSLNTIPGLYNSQFWGAYNIYNYVKMAPESVTEVESKLMPLLQRYMEPQIQSVLGISWKQYEEAGNAHRYFFQPIGDIHLHSALQWELEPNGSLSTVYLFTGISAFILLIACINFINLSTARSANRAKEVGMRKVLGAIKGQLMIQFLTESVLMCLLALVLAMGLTALILPFFNELSGKFITISSFLSPAMLAILLSFTLTLGIVSGLYPAFFLSAFKPVMVLKGKLKGGAKNSWLRNGLVIFQFAVSIVLVIGTMVIYQQLQFLNDKSLGFDKDQLVVVERAGLLANQSTTFKNALLQNPDVLDVTGMNSIPGRQITGGTFTDVTGDASDRFLMPNLTGDYDLIATMGLEMVEGRAFDPEIVTDSTAVIINEAAARTFKWQDPIGKQLQPINGPIFQVIGVVKDFHYESLHQEIRPLALFARNLDAQPANLMVVKLNTQNLSETLRFLDDQWAAFVPERALAYRFVNEEFGALYAAEQRSGKIFTAFSTLAIFIACLGAFGLAAFLATQRIKEIGVRKVLGASTFGIVSLLSKDFVKLILIANLVGWPLAYLGMQRWLESFAYAVGVNWLTFILVAVGSIAIALITVSYHSIRAALNNPADTLHHD
ncbi:MAG: FtsX-like permease family protein [Roseivirga sp.]|nr:FtsX-like permease family protein [Roseivirga sp.]